MIQHPLQGADAPRPADDAQMQSQGHHARPQGGGFLDQPIEAVDGVLRPLPGRQRGRGPHLHVVGVQRVGQNQQRPPALRTAVHPLPEGQVVGIVIHVVGEALLQQQPLGVVGVQETGKPSQRAGARGRLNAAPGIPYEGPFLRFVHAELMHPTMAVAGHLMPIGN